MAPRTSHDNKWVGKYIHLRIQLNVVLTNIGDNIAYQHGLHFCWEVIRLSKHIMTKVNLVE